MENETTTGWSRWDSCDSKVRTYDVFGNGATGSGKLSPSPEATAPVPFADLGKRPLDLERRTALHHAHPIADRPLRGHRDEHVHMIRRDHAAHDGDAVLLTDLATDIPDPEAQVPAQHLVAILRRPDNVIPVVKDTMCARIIRRPLD